MFAGESIGSSASSSDWTSRLPGIPLSMVPGTVAFCPTMPDSALIGTTTMPPALGDGIGNVEPLYVTPLDGSVES